MGCKKQDLTPGDPGSSSQANVADFDAMSQT